MGDTFAFFSNEGSYLLRRKCPSHTLNGTVPTMLPKIMSQLSGSMEVALVMEHLMPNLESVGGQTQMIKNGVSTTNTRTPISSRKFLQRKMQYEHSRNVGTITFKFAQIQTISLTACTNTSPNGLKMAGLPPQAMKLFTEMHWRIYLSWKNPSMLNMSGFHDQRIKKPTSWLESLQITPEDFKSI